MAPPKTSFEQGKASSLPAYLLLRIFFAACITLGPLTLLLYAILGPSGRGSQAIIAANIAENATMNQLHLLFGVLASCLLGSWAWHGFRCDAQPGSEASPSSLPCQAGRLSPRSSPWMP